jgi:tryptophanyl-tRNA synthetase
MFNTITPLGELERQTQFKEKSQRQESVPAGILNYPVLQAADILLYRADMVPVGEDQVQHLELSRVISRRWNASFGRLTGRRTADGGEEREEFFPEPKPLLTPTRRIMGLDGQTKMSKSMGNTVALLESPDSIWASCARRSPIRNASSARTRDAEVCNIYHLHKAFSPSPPSSTWRRNATARVGLHRLQEGPGRVDGDRVGADSRAAAALGGEARARGRRALGRRREVPRPGAKTMDVVRDRMGF